MFAPINPVGDYYNSVSEKAQKHVFSDLDLFSSK